LTARPLPSLSLDRNPESPRPPARRHWRCTVVDPASGCADYHRRGLERIAATVGAVLLATMYNLANLNAAMGGGLLDLIEVRLFAVGVGPTLDLPARRRSTPGSRP
jgi:hypothetical protein